MNSTPDRLEVLIPRVAASAALIEEQARLPPELARDLKAASAFSQLLPAWLGGAQPELPDYLRLVRRFAEADGSVAWCINQGSVLASLAHHFDEDDAKQIWHQPSVTVANGPPAGSRVRRTDGGYLLSGRWTFSSGILQADHVIGVATLEEGDRREGLWCFMPRDAVTIDESWPVSGLRGTASYAFSVDDVFVPSSHAVTLKPRESAPLYRIPLNLLFACGFASVALGVSRAAIDFTIDRVRTKVKRFARQSMAHADRVKGEIGRAEAEWTAAAALLDHAVEDVWGAIEGPLDVDDRMKLRMAATHTIWASRAATDRVYHLCSTDAIFQHNEIHRRFQDMHVITQHLQARPEIYEMVGGYLLETDFDHGLIS